MGAIEDTLAHLLMLRASLRAYETNIDACIRLLTTPEESKAADESDPQPCKHARKMDYTSAGQEPWSKWMCPDCGEKGGSW